MTALTADEVFRSQDDPVYTLENSGEDGPAEPLYFSNDAKRLSEGNYSWFATLVPATNGQDHVLAVVTFSKRVMETVGKKLVRLDPFSAFIVVFSEGITVHLYTFVGVPVSTSHALVGAILGVGIIKGINTVSRSTLLNILLGWLLTPVAAALITLGIAFVIQLQYIPGL